MLLATPCMLFCPPPHRPVPASPIPSGTPLELTPHPSLASVPDHRLQVEAWDPSNVSIFSTRNQESKTDAYFLDSASGVSFFFEEKAFDQDGQLAVPKEHAVNKIGHGEGAGAGCEECVEQLQGFRQNRVFTSKLASEFAVNAAIHPLPFSQSDLQSPALQTPCPCSHA